MLYYHCENIFTHNFQKFCNEILGGSEFHNERKSSLRKIYYIIKPLEVLKRSTDLNN